MLSLLTVLTCHNLNPATRLHDLFAPAPTASATTDSTINEEGGGGGGGGGGGKRESRPGVEEGSERGAQDLQPHTQTLERLGWFEAELVEVEGNISQILRDHTDEHGAVVGKKHKNLLEQSARHVDSIQVDLFRLTETLSAHVKHAGILLLPLDGSHMQQRTENAKRQQAAHSDAGLGPHTVAELTTQAIDVATSRIAAEKATKKSQDAEVRAAWFERWGAGFVHTKKGVAIPLAIVAWVQQSLQTSSSAPSYTTLKAEALETFSEAEWNENKASIKQLLMLEAPTSFPPGPTPTLPSLSQMDLDAVTNCMAPECTTSFSFFTQRNSCNVCASVVCKECISGHVDMQKDSQVCSSCAAMISERVELDSVELIEWANKEALAQVTAARAVRVQCKAAEDVFASKKETQRRDMKKAAAKVGAIAGRAKQLAAKLESQHQIDATVAARLATAKQTAANELATAKLGSVAAYFIMDHETIFSQFQVPDSLEVKVVEVETTLSLLNEMNEVLRCQIVADLEGTVETRDQARMAYLAAVSTLVSAAFACVARCKNATSVIDMLEHSSIFNPFIDFLAAIIEDSKAVIDNSDSGGGVDALLSTCLSKTKHTAPMKNKKGGLFDSDDSFYRNLGWTRTRMRAAPRVPPARNDSDEAEDIADLLSDGGDNGVQEWGDDDEQELKDDLDANEEAALAPAPVVTAPPKKKYSRGLFAGCFGSDDDESEEDDMFGNSKKAAAPATASATAASATAASAAVAAAAAAAAPAAPAPTKKKKGGLFDSDDDDEDDADIFGTDPKAKSKPKPEPEPEPPKEPKLQTKDEVLFVDGVDDDDKDEDMFGGDVAVSTSKKTSAAKIVGELFRDDLDDDNLLSVPPKKRVAAAKKFVDALFGENNDDDDLFRDPPSLKAVESEGGLDDPIKAAAKKKTSKKGGAAVVVDAKTSEKKPKSGITGDSVDIFAEGPVVLMALGKAIAKWKVSKEMLMPDQTIADAPEDATIAIDASFPVAEVVEAIKWMKVAAPLAIERFAVITTIAEHHQVIAGAMKEWGDPNVKKGLLAGVKLARDAKRKTRKQLKRAQLTLEEAADSDGSGGDDEPTHEALEGALQSAKSAYSKAVKAENKIRAKLAIAIRDHYPELVSMLDIHSDPIYKLMEQLKSVPVYESRVHYELGDRIQGGTHEVQRATNTISPDDSDSQTEVVLKRFVLGEASSRKTFEKEITILARMRHPNVIRLTGVVYEPKKAVAYLELPYLASGDLRAHLGAEELNRGSAMVQQVFSDLCKALDYLHTSGVVHCDVKPDNILIDGNGTAKLTDFDVSKDARSRALAVGTTASTTKAIGGLTYGYAAPEVMATAACGGGSGSAATTANEMPGTPADMWSAGCVLYFMAFYPRELTLETSKAPTAQLPAKCDAAIRSLLTALWVHQPSKRPTAAETLTAPYFAVDVAVAVKPPAHAVPFDRDHWSSSNKAGADARKRFLVDSTSDEYKTVAASFFKTQTDKNIDSIERIENGALQESFATSERNMREQLKSWGPAATSSTIVKQLFHGTKAVDLIVNSTDGHGFLPLLAGTAVGAIWGDGTYFARDAKYSDAYAEQLPSGRKQMLVVDVLVGRYTQGVKGMKTCPLLPGEKYNRYNSLVDNMQYPGIFVVQHSDQAYPKYVITYH